MADGSETDREGSVAHCLLPAIRENVAKGITEPDDLSAPNE
jgi:hypothetical protein